MRAAAASAAFGASHVTRRVARDVDPGGRHPFLGGLRECRGVQRGFPFFRVQRRRRAMIPAAQVIAAPTAVSGSSLSPQKTHPSRAAKTTFA